MLTFTDVTIGPATFSIGTLAVCAGLVLIGYQSVWFALLSKCFASREGLLPDDVRVDSLPAAVPARARADRCRRVAVVAGVAGLVWAAAGWDFRPLDPTRSMRLILPSVTVLVLGLQTALCSLLLSIVGLPSARPAAEPPLTSSGRTTWREAARPLDPGPAHRPRRPLRPARRPGAGRRLPRRRAVPRLGAGLRDGVGLDPALVGPLDGERYHLHPGAFPADAPDEPGSFDAVTMLAVLEHIPPDQQPAVAAARLPPACSPAAVSS